MKLILTRLVFIVAFFFAVPSMGQQNPYLLEWQIHKPLQWENFKGQPDSRDHVHAAVTYAGLRVRESKEKVVKGKSVYEVKAVFDQQKSWAHPSRKDPRILNHEQLHFNITEVYARKLQQKINALQLTNRRQHKLLVNKLKHVYARAQLAAQRRFDEETLHGLHSEIEAEWHIRIQQELASPTASLDIIRRQSFTNTKQMRQSQQHH